MKPSIDGYGFPASVVERARPVAEAFERSSAAVAGRALADLTEALCDEIEGGRLAAKDADKVFTVLDLYLGERFRNEALQSEVIELLTEGMTLHHLGEDVGTDLATLRRLASALRD